MPANTPPPSAAWQAWLATARLAGHSHSFRHLESPAAILGALRTAGLARVELWPGHARLNAPETWVEWKRLLDGEGFACDALGIFPFTGADGEQAVFDLARAVGASVVNADYSLPHLPGVVSTVDAWAQAAGMKVALHNNGAPHWLGNRAMFTHIIRNSSPAIGLCLDTYWALDSREDCVRILQDLGERVFAIHLRDGISLPDRTLLEKDLGDGAADVREVLACLLARSYSGPVVFEHKGAPARSIPESLRRFRLGPSAFRPRNASFSLPAS